ncbi:MAG: hypothetical protein OEV21_04070 [Thermoplasmata archaeon]|nr:hypothetical protein [Thermoplasmata archaeon]
MMAWEASNQEIVGLLSSERHFEIAAPEGMIDMWAPPRLTFTRPFIESATPELLDSFSRRFFSITQYFPEVRGKIRVGMTNSYKGLAMTESDGNTMLKKISFPPLRRAGLPSRYVMGHELMHIVQAKQKFIPGTERACDLFTLSRLPPKHLDHPPIYLRMPRSVRSNWSRERIRPIVADMAHDVAIEAVISRKSNRRYINWWENEFRERVESSSSLSRFL